MCLASESIIALAATVRQSEEARGIAATRGHVQGNGGLRGHSVGDVFPYVIYAVGNPHGKLKWAVLTPQGVAIEAFTNYGAAHRWALWRKTCEVKV